MPSCPPTVVVNLRAAWQIDADWQLFGAVDNLFDNRDALYGTYFDPDRHRRSDHAGPDRSAHCDLAPARRPSNLGLKLTVLAPSLYTGAMLRLTDIKLPLDHRPEALKAAILKKLKLPGRGAARLAGLQARP